MNDNLNDILWEEKNSTEPQKNYENKSVLETKDTTNGIQKNVENLHWKDITDPKERQKAYNKVYREANKEKLKVQEKIWYESNKEKRKVQKKAWRKSNRDKIKVQKKNWDINNKNEIKVYHIINKEKIRNQQKIWRDLNKEKIKIKQKIYREVNKDKIKIYNKNKLKTDIQTKLSHGLRSRLYKAIDGNFKVGSAVKDLGCSIEQLKQHLESKFLPGMNWDNWTHDGWHIDHIKPLDSFDLTDRQQFLEACHYTNLQPLWAKDNLVKSNKLI